MQYKLTIGEDTLPVEIEMTSENTISAIMGENEYDIGFSPVCDNQIHLDVNGIGMNVYVMEIRDGKIVMLDGKSFFVQDADFLEQSQVKKRSINSIPTQVTPPMPAVVIAVLVKEGDLVEQGKAVVVLSAMKMETTLVAPFRGVVTKVNVQEGDKVMPKDILIDIEATEDV
ncbi:MAG: hypothetical protein KKD21_08270 [Proteobacteria bacterium]|nr:hypothetical protein [Pseudomonadota bacterium]MBU1697022.1 hypothetical protein [Pseudomonadota bacterium]